jgi:hypothetical protein
MSLRPPFRTVASNTSEAVGAITDADNQVRAPSRITPSDVAALTG